MFLRTPTLRARHPFDEGEDRLRRSVWTVVATAAALVCLRSLFRRGMFYDGTLYATLARNLALGEGDAWHPQATATFMHVFREHPPLAFWLQSLWFRVLGDHIWVERAYGACCGLLTALCVVGIWRQLFAARNRALACAWLPVALWMCCCWWTYVHNMLENTLGVFTALSVYAVLRAQSTCRWPLAWSALAGLSITAAVLAKGPVGMFPLIAPATAWLTLRRTTWQGACVRQATLLAASLASLGALLAWGDCRQYLAQYLRQQCLASVTGQRESVQTLLQHGEILLLLARVIVVPLGIATLIVLAARWRRASSQPAPPAIEGDLIGRSGWFCLLTALSASLPLILSPKQAGHYAAPSYPFFVLASAIWCLPAVLELAPQLAAFITCRVALALRAAAAVAVGLAAIWSCAGYGSCIRNRQLIEAADQIATHFAPHGIVYVDPVDWQHLPPDDRLLLHAYLYRYHRVSLTTDEPQPIYRFEFLRLTPLSGEWMISADQAPGPVGMTCAAVVPRPAIEMADLPALRR